MATQLAVLKRTGATVVHFPIPLISTTLFDFLEALAATLVPIIAMIYMASLGNTAGVEASR
jgi:hypothetical protein